MSRVKKPIISVDKVGAEEAFADYSKAEARLKQILAKMDVEFTKIREKHQDEISKLMEQKETAFERLQTYAEKNRVDFGNRKSMELTHGIIGFRTGTPKLKTLKGHTWASVLHLIKVYLPGYVRVYEEPAKDRLLADREEPEVLEKLKDIGVYVDQDENFFVEPKTEELAELV